MMGAAIIRAACRPLKFLDELVAALGDAIGGAITGAAIGWLERRGYRIEPPGERRWPNS
jgi:hypothetical protein